MPEWPLPPHPIEIALGKSGVHAFEGDFDEFRELWIGTARAAWLTDVSPGGDPPPMIAFGHDDRVTLMRIPGHAFENAASKELLMERLVPTMIVGGRCRFVGLATSNWIVHADSPAGIEVERLRVANLPIPSFSELGLNGVQEQAIAHVYRRGNYEMWQAKITRLTDGAPIIGKFRQPEDAAYFTGLFIDPVLEALEAVADE